MPISAALVAVMLLASSGERSDNRSTDAIGRPGEILPAPALALANGIDGEAIEGDLAAWNTMVS